MFNITRAIIYALRAGQRPHNLDQWAELACSTTLRLVPYGVYRVALYLNTSWNTHYCFAVRVILFPFPSVFILECSPRWLDIQSVWILALICRNAKCRIDRVSWFRNVFRTCATLKINEGWVTCSLFFAISRSVVRGFCSNKWWALRSNKSIGALEIMGTFYQFQVVLGYIVIVASQFDGLCNTSYCSHISLTSFEEPASQ